MGSRLATSPFFRHDETSARGCVKRGLTIFVTLIEYFGGFIQRLRLVDRDPAHTVALVR